ncbi:MAG: glycosyltransferase [Anaerolineales bacterium]|nr:glycosyltransferase [Anaerolineales bacterium]
MKILYVSEQYGPHDQRFLAAISEAGHQALFWGAKADEVKGHALPESVSFAEGELHATIHDFQPDVVHAGPLHTRAYQAAQTGFHPLVAMSWGSDILHTARRNWFARRRVRKALRAADVLIADCQAVADAAAELAFPVERIVQFPWGVDLQRFNPAGGDGGLRARLGWEDAFVVLHLRAWEALYGSEVVLRAFLALAPSQPRLRLLMPGGGSLAARFESLLARSGLAERVHLPGAVPQADLPAYYRAADLYLSASHSDGSSVSLIEALASGLPVAVSDIPSNREWVQQGWFFPVGNQDALAAAILSAMNSEDLPQAAQTARRIAEERADWSRNKLGLQRAYEMALGA